MAKHNLVELNSAYTPYRRDVKEVNDEPSMTRQEMSEDCDINVIMKRYEKTGVLPVGLQQRDPVYLDLTVQPESLIDAMNTMIDAENAFMALPATVRRDFDNDPMRFVEFATDPENIDQMRTWGLAPPAPVKPEPQEVRVVNPEPSGSPKAAKSTGADVPAD